MKSILSRTHEWDLDIDHYLNRIIPPSPLPHFPKPIARFLGYRKKQRQDVGNVMGAFWSCLGAFCGLAVVAAVFNNTPSIRDHHAPLIASFGASAILEYNTVRSPLGQPRNALLGHTFSAIIGVGITKLFKLHSDWESIQWIAAAVSCGVASAVMLITGTVHPPGGASAVIAATVPVFTEMGWFFVGLVMYGCTLMLAVALVLNNIQRQFPLYWWTPLDLRKAKAKDMETWPDAKGALEQRRTNENDDDETVEGSEDGRTVIGEKQSSQGEISISAYEVLVPKDLSLNQEETRLLESLRDRLRKRRQGDGGESERSLEMVQSRGAASDGSGSTLGP